jgi:hypothetical protein
LADAFDGGVEVTGCDLFTFRRKIVIKNSYRKNCT